MNLNANNSINFQGIKGTAILSDGKKVAINLIGDSARLEALSKEDTRFDSSFIINVMENDKAKATPFIDGTRFENIILDEVDGNSLVQLAIRGQREIGELKDNAKLFLYKTWANIRRISGEKVKIQLDNMSAFHVTEPARVKIITPQVEIGDGGTCELIAEGRDFGYFA